MAGEQKTNSEVGLRARVRFATLEDSGAIAAVHVASWRSTYRHLLPDDFLAGLSVQRRQEMWRGQVEAIQEKKSKSCLLVTELPGGNVVGFASAGLEREQDSGFDGELYAIYLLAEHQGKGLGSKLLRRAALHLKSIGCRSMRLWVLQGNPAIHFYERSGGTISGKKTIRIAGSAHIEIAYAWNDLAILDANL